MKFKTILILMIATVVFSADSSNVRLSSKITTAPLRGITSDLETIIAFCKSSKAYSVQYFGGESIVILDSIAWSGSSLPSGTDLAGRWISAKNSIAYLADWTRGLHYIDFSNPSSLVDLGGMSLGGQVRSASVSGERLFLGAGSGGVHFLNITTPSEPHLVTTYDVGGSALDVTADESSTMIVAEYPTGVSAWDMTSPSAPTAFITLSGTVSGVEYAGVDTVIIATDFDGNLHLLRHSSEGLITILNTLTPGNDVIFKTIYSEGLVAVACGTSGLWVYSLASDGFSVADSGYYIPDRCNLVDVCFFEEHAVAADADGAIWLFDLRHFYGDIAEGRLLPSELNVSVFPNPFNSAVRIEIQSDDRSFESVEIFDIMGKHVASFNPHEIVKESSDNTGTKSLHQVIWTPSEDLQSGLFFVRVTGSNTVNRRIVYLK